MKVNGARHLLAILIVFICFGTVFGQTKSKKLAFVGNIELEIKSKDNQKEKKFFDVPVNGQQLKFRWSDSIRSEFSETNKVTQLNWNAVADEDNIQRASLNLRLMVSDDYGKTKTVKKKIKILKGETKSFRIKNKDFYYEITAFYESENK